MRVTSWWQPMLAYPEVRQVGSRKAFANRPLNGS
jgi:hypothetical protein